jgi:arginine exporter protein ArgO
MKTLAGQTSTSVPTDANQVNVSFYDRVAIFEVLLRRMLRDKGGTFVAAARIGLVGFLLGFGETAVAASVDAASASMVFPVVAQTASYISEITVFNPHVGFDLFVDVEYVGGEGTSCFLHNKPCNSASVQNVPYLPAINSAR